MPMTASDIQYLFKVVGKAIKMGNLGAQTSIDYESMSSATNRQISPSGINREYDEIKYIGLPIQQQVDQLAQIGDGMAGVMKTVVAGYLSSGVAPDLGLTAGTSANTVVAALATQMVATSQTVGTSGALTQDKNYAAYFFNNFGATLPQSSNPTIPDAWITNVMVP